MTCTHANLGSLGKVIICSSPDYRIVDKGGRVWYFEFHKYCGPMILGKNGDPLKNQPGERSPFWDVFQLWFDQGQRSQDGKGGRWAVYDLPPRKGKEGR